MKDTTNFVGYAPVGAIEFFKDASRILRGTGYYLHKRGRNPNRKQFYAERGRYATRQSIPLECATYVGLYLHKTRNNNVFMNEGYEAARLHVARVSGMVDAVRKIHQIHGKDLTVTTK